MTGSLSFLRPSPRLSDLKEWSPSFENITWEEHLRQEEEWCCDQNREFDFVRDALPIECDDVHDRGPCIEKGD